MKNCFPILRIIGQSKKTWKKSNFFNVMKIDHDTREASETSSRVTTSDMETIWNLYGNICEKTSPQMTRNELSEQVIRSKSSNGVGTIRKSVKIIILIGISDDGFGEDLMCEMFGQSGLRSAYWRTPCLAVWRPMESQRRVLRTKSWFFIGHQNW